MSSIETIDIVNWIKSRRQLSTLLSAVMLASIWTLAWLLVFTASLFFLSESSTSLYGLFIGMWLSTCVEAIIRYFENTKIAVQFGKPHEKNPKGDNQDYSIGRALLLLFFGIMVLLIIGYVIAQDWMVVPALSFDGVPRGTNPSEKIDMWLVAFQHPVTIAMITSCFLLRVAIYKRVAH